MKFRTAISCIAVSAMLSSLSVPAFAANGLSDSSIAAEKLFSTDEALYTSENPISVFAAESDGDGSGGKIDADVEITTIEINSADDLRSFRDAVNGTGEASLKARVATVNLNCDIDLGGEEWVPIGNSSDPTNLYANSFCGTFNGNGHTISNFKITDNNLRATGLFSAVTALRRALYNGYENDIAISNLTVSDVVVDIQNSEKIECVSALCGLALMPAVFENVNVKSSSINAVKTTGSTILSIGMIIGFGKIDIDGAYAEGTINFTAPSNAYAGGIIGLDDDDGEDSNNLYIGPHTYKNCTSAVSITGEGHGNLMLGGIAGYLSKNVAVVNCDYLSGNSLNATGNLNAANASSNYASGIAGYSHSSFENCNVGEVSIVADGVANVGVSGITAMLYQDMLNCTSAANLKVTGEENTFRTYAGGLAYLMANDSNSAKPLEKHEALVENCSWTGKSISIDTYGPILAGGITGRLSGGFTVKNCYADFDKIDITVHGNGRNPATGDGVKSIVYAGGAIGYVLGANVTQVAASGKLTMTNTLTVANTNYIGGITGYVNQGTYYYKDENDVVAGKTVPGTLTMSHSDVELDVSGASVYVGGISGYLTSSGKLTPTQSKITDCVSSKNVTVTPVTTSIVGGGIGYTVDSYIADCASFGDLIIQPRSNTALIIGGGFIGRLKEANIVWEDVENPLSQTYRCYATGTVRPSVITQGLTYGPFTDAVVNNNTGKEKPAVIVTPIYDQCYYVGETQENAVGTAIADASDKSSYQGFDFTNLWTMRDGKAMPLSAVPAVCDINYTELNGEPIKVNSVTVSMPEKVKSLALIVNDSFSSESEVVKMIPIGEIKSSEKYFKTIDVNYDIDLFTTVDVVAVENDALQVNSEVLDGSTFHATLLNGTNEKHTVSLYAAEYDENGALKALTITPHDIDANSALPISTNVSDSTTKVYLWDDGQAPLCSAITK